MEIDAIGSEKSLSFCCLKIDNVFCVSCLTREGTGGFLVTAMTYAMKQLRIEFEKETGKLKTEWNDFEKKAFQDKISDMAMKT